MPIATFAVSNWGGSRLKGVTRRLGLFLLCWGRRQVDKEADTCHRQRGSESLPLRALLDGVVLTCQSRRDERDRSRCGVVRRIVDLNDHRTRCLAVAGIGEHCIGRVAGEQ